MNNLLRRSKREIIIPILTMCLSLFGIVMIYSASSYASAIQNGNAYYYVNKQSVAFVLGTALMLLISRMKVDKLSKFSLPILVFSYVLLALVFIPGFGVEYYGATRWINLGLFTIQPSEFSKFCLVIFIAAYASTHSVATIKGLAVVLFVGAIMAVLIMLEPNMSITICVLAVTVIMLFFAGAKLKHFAYLVIPAIAMVVLLIVLEPYRMKRIVAFVDPWANPKVEGYQLIQSYYALGSGGWFGVGLFNSRQKYLFLPFAESDFILAIVGEELGYLGMLFVGAAYLALIFRGYYVAAHANERFKCYLAAGITTVLAVQTMLNIAVVSGSIPPTGLPLPFLSSGGSSLIAYQGAMGLVCAISNDNKHRITRKQKLA